MDGPLIYRRDRWVEILNRLRDGGDYGIEVPQVKKSNAYVYVYGRKMTIGEAADLSGIDNAFYKKYEGAEVPEEDIVARLDYQWMREKSQQLKWGMG